MDHNELAICIMFNEKADQTIECLNSFSQLDSPIYLLNNGSSFGCTQKVKRALENLKNVTYFYSDQNVGVSKGRNYLIENTNEDYLFFIDNDMKIFDAKDFWNNLNSSIFVTDDEVLIVCPRIYNEHLSSFHEPHRFVIDGQIINIKKAIKNHSGYISTNYFPGGASIFKRRFFNLYGNYDEHMFVGFEDYDLSFTAWKDQSFSDFVFELPNITVIHDHQIPKTNEEKNAVKLRYNPNLIENSFNYFVTKHSEFEFNIEYIEWLNQKIESLT